MNKFFLIYLSITSFMFASIFLLSILIMLAQNHYNSKFVRVKYQWLQHLFDTSSVTSHFDDSKRIFGMFYDVAITTIFWPIILFVLLCHTAPRFLSFVLSLFGRTRFFQKIISFITIPPPTRHIENEEVIVNVYEPKVKIKECQDGGQKCVKNDNVENLKFKFISLGQT